MTVADSTDNCTLTLWEEDVDSLKLNQSYYITKLNIRIFQGDYKATTLSLYQAQDLQLITSSHTDTYTHTRSNTHSFQLLPHTHTHTYFVPTLPTLPTHTTHTHLHLHTLSYIRLPAIKLIPLFTAVAACIVITGSPPHVSLNILFVTKYHIASCIRYITNNNHPQPTHRTKWNNLHNYYTQDLTHRTWHSCVLMRHHSHIIQCTDNMCTYWKCVLTERRMLSNIDGIEVGGQQTAWMWHKGNRYT